MLEHTRFTVKYLRTESLRRQVQSRLNTGEAVNSLARALFFGRHGVMHDRAFDDPRLANEAIFTLRGDAR